MSCSKCGIARSKEDILARLEHINKRLGILQAEMGYTFSGESMYWEEYIGLKAEGKCILWVLTEDCPKRYISNSEVL
jgi:hypothetical protein